MGAHPQLLSRVYVSSEDWPSLLMSLLTTVPSLGWAQSSFSPAAACRGGGCWAHRAGGTAKPHSCLLDWADGPRSLYSSRFSERPFFILLSASFSYFSWMRPYCWELSTTSELNILSSYWGLVREKERHLVFFEFSWSGANESCKLWLLGIMSCSGNDSNDLLFKSLLKNYLDTPFTFAKAFCFTLAWLAG